MARPSERTPEVEQRIIERILAGNSLTRICKTDEDVPALSTVFKWLSEDEAKRRGGKVTPGEILFADQYRVAADLRVDYWREEALDIADDGSNDTYTDDNGDTVVNHDHIQRSRLRVQYRQWLMGVMAPKKYGKAAETQVNVNSETHVHNHVSLERQKLLQDRHQAALAKR
jgi:hypothetical protein